MAAHCSAWLFSCLPCGDTLLWPLDEVDCAEASLHPPLQTLDLEQSLLQTGAAPGREEGMYTDAPGLQLHAPGEQEQGRHSKLVFHDSLAGEDSRPHDATAACGAQEKFKVVAETNKKLCHFCCASMHVQHHMNWLQGSRPCQAPLGSLHCACNHPLREVCLHANNVRPNK